VLCISKQATDTCGEISYSGDNSCYQLGPWQLTALADSVKGLFRINASNRWAK